MPFLLQTKSLCQKHWALNSTDILALSFHNTATKPNLSLKGKQSIATVPKVFSINTVELMTPQVCSGYASVGLMTIRKFNLLQLHDVDTTEVITELSKADV